LPVAYVPSKLNIERSIRGLNVAQSEEPREESRIIKRLSIEDVRFKRVFVKKKLRRPEGSIGFLDTKSARSLSSRGRLPVP